MDKNILAKVLWLTVLGIVFAFIFYAWLKTVNDFSMIAMVAAESGLNSGGMIAMLIILGEIIFLTYLWWKFGIFLRHRIEYFLRRWR